MAKKKQTVYKPPKNSNKGFILVIAGIFILAAVLLFFVSNQDQNSGQETNTIDVPYEGQPSIGSKDAPVKIVEFADFKCPYCADFSKQIYPKIKADFIDTGKVEMYFVNKPFIASDSTTAALIGEAVYAQDQDAVWDYYKTVFEHQGNEKEAWATEDYLIGLVEKNIEGINIAQLRKGLDDKGINEAVEKDRKISDQVESTPSILVNEKQINNPFDYENEIKPAIEKALKES